MGLQFWNPKFNILCKKSIYIFYEMPALCNAKPNKTILKEVKVAEQDYDDVLQYFQKLCTQNQFQKQYMI